MSRNAQLCRVPHALEPVHMLLSMYNGPPKMGQCCVLLYIYIAFDHVCMPPAWIWGFAERLAANAGSSDHDPPGWHIVSGMQVNHVLILSLQCLQSTVMLSAFDTHETWQQYGRMLCLQTGKTFNTPEHAKSIKNCVSHHSPNLMSLANISGTLMGLTS